MGTDNVKQFLDRKISELSAQLEQFKVLRAAADNEQLFGELSEAMHGNSNGSTKPGGKKPTEGISNRQRVVDYFTDRNNDWAAAADIMHGAGLDRGIVNNILYVASADDFESKNHPKLKRRKLWRVKPKG